jgi:Uma2 family endonuclease
MENLAILTQIEKPMPSRHHAKLQSRLAHLLLKKYEEIYDIFTELSLELSTGNPDPDIAILPKSAENWLEDEIRVKEVPLSVIEILLPTQSVQTLADKKDIYFGAGVKSYWVVVPTFTTIYLILADLQTFTFTSGIIKDPATGVELAFDEIFR